MSQQIQQIITQEPIAEGRVAAALQRIVDTAKYQFLATYGENRNRVRVHDARVTAFQVDRSEHGNYVIATVDIHFTYYL